MQYPLHTNEQGSDIYSTVYYKDNDFDQLGNYCKTYNLLQFVCLLQYSILKSLLIEQSCNLVLLYSSLVLLRWSRFE